MTGKWDLFGVCVIKHCAEGPYFCDDDYPIDNISARMLTLIIITLAASKFIYGFNCGGDQINVSRKQRAMPLLEHSDSFGLWNTYYNK